MLCSLEKCRCYSYVVWRSVDVTVMQFGNDGNEMMVRPLVCTLFRLNWAKQTPGIMRRN